MSIHANQAVKDGPSSSRDEIQGANPTYKASVQKESRSQSSTKAAGSGEVEKAEGEGSAPVDMNPTENVGSFGDGHYKPNKG